MLPSMNRNHRLPIICRNHRCCLITGKDRFLLFIFSAIDLSWGHIVSSFWFVKSFWLSTTMAFCIPVTLWSPSWEMCWRKHSQKEINLNLSHISYILVSCFCDTLLSVVVCRRRLSGCWLCRRVQRHPWSHHGVRCYQTVVQLLWTLVLWSRTIST